jgi:gluconokinase
MVFIVMGVSGSGKTTVGKALSKRFGWKYYEGDEYHPAGNIEKMKRGIPLDDEDRLPWLQSLRKIIEEAANKNENIVIACSALKEAYREILRGHVPDLPLSANNEVKFIYLKGSYNTIKERMEKRPDHFFKPEMLKSQFNTLEEPQDAIIIDISKPNQETISDVIESVRGYLSYQKKD